MEAKEKTFYLFGNDAVNEFNENGIEGLIDEIENNNLGYAVFEFIEGKTRSSELMEAADGWGDYLILTEEEYNQL